jgi:hypothetical protein
MERIENSGDDRNTGWCIYCAGPMETQDHVPSRVFLDEPFPRNPPSLPSCLACNKSFSLDEEYLACFIEAAKAGSVEQAILRRPKVARILAHTPLLASRLTAARSESVDGIIWTPEHARVQNVILKLAKGHMS